VSGGDTRLGIQYLHYCIQSRAKDWPQQVGGDNEMSVGWSVGDGDAWLMNNFTEYNKLQRSNA
jgi:hypothetical protein